ncbi:hypothetical protein H4Q26_007273 [Puccinia striiformis f. sp. tritici PST-130]|uniref:Uncharacterized protein n=1 Tax=Puccinia striiformis f. sp. tritici PST-78 TaxID=1165861 RepID=A0A0L0VCV4_9BASI|nr:hypothetical protein H4Q26_007273 [Puccinia striiformis f. sp. tritici PST-130]KNE97026.1 hypothetical protein PSTG_09761 [Puccinia striiformis f. sp. tritici PST-78]
MGCHRQLSLSLFVFIFIDCANAVFSSATPHALLWDSWAPAPEAVRNEINFDELDAYLESVKSTSSQANGRDLEMTPTRPELLSPSHQAQGRLSKLPYEFASSPSSHQNSQTSEGRLKRGEKRHFLGGGRKSKQAVEPGVATEKSASDHLKSYAPNQFLESPASPHDDLTFEELQMMWDELEKYPPPFKTSNQEEHPAVINPPLPGLLFDEEPGHEGAVGSPRMAASPVSPKRQRISESLDSGRKTNVNFLTSTLPKTVFSVIQHDQWNHGTFESFGESCSKAYEETNPVVDSSKNVELPTPPSSSVEHHHEIPDPVDFSSDSQVASSGSVFPLTAYLPKRLEIQKSGGELVGQDLGSSKEDPIDKTTCEVDTSQHQPKYPRLSFEKDIFDSQDLSNKDQLQCERILSLVKNKAKLIMRPDEIIQAKRKMRGPGRGSADKESKYSSKPQRTIRMSMGSNKLTRQSKGVINTFFTYSAGQLTKHYKDLIENPQLTVYQPHLK